jgi:hypothetical protein
VQLALPVAPVATHHTLSTPGGTQGNVSRQLAVVMDLGGRVEPVPPLAAEGASSIRVAKKNARCTGLRGQAPKARARRPGRDGWELRRLLLPGGGQEEKSHCLLLRPIASSVASPRRLRAVDEHRASRPCSYSMHGYLDSV